MRLNFLVNEVAGGWEPTDKRLGGTEESIVRWAEELTKRGHNVTVWHNSHHGEYAMHNKVHYLPRASYSSGADICINVKSSEIEPIEPTLYLTNETDATIRNLSKYLGVIWPSDWAEENIPVNNPRRFIVPHGYDDKKINSHTQKIKKQCLYASSPDRGLKDLETIWPSVVEQHPDAQLIVTYGGKIHTPNTTCGDYTDEEMNELFNTSDLWVYPCSGGELFGITGIKAQAAGAIPVYFPTMALSETVQAGAACTDLRDMYNTLCALLDNEEAKKAYRNDLAKLKLPTWEISTDRLLEVIMEVV